MAVGVRVIDSIPVRPTKSGGVRSLERQDPAAVSRVSHAVRSLYARLVTKTLVFRHDGIADTSRDEERVSGATWLIANSENVRELFREDAQRSRLFLRFLASGCLGLLLVRDGEWIAYGWSTRPGKGRPPHLPQGVQSLDCHWIFGCHTRREFRGQGIYRRLLKRMVALVGKEDCGPVYTDVLPENMASQAAVLASGFNRCGVTRTFKLWIPRLAHLPLTGSWTHDEPRLPTPFVACLGAKQIRKPQTCWGFPRQTRDTQEARKTPGARCKPTTSQRDAEGLLARRKRDVRNTRVPPCF